MDNIFSNIIDPNIILGNLTTVSSSNLPQFTIFSYIFGNNQVINLINLIDRENFIIDIFLLNGRIYRKLMNSLLPLILQPTRITSHSNTLMDNIFSNIINPNIILGNVTTAIFNNLPQFKIFSYIFGNNQVTNLINLVDRENPILDIFLLNERIY